MAKVGSYFRDHERRRKIDRLCKIGQYRDEMTWAQILEHDVEWIKFLLYETDVPLDDDLVSELEDALETFESL